MPFPAILGALQQARVDFICLSDHCNFGRADFGAQWRGVHAGTLFIPGYEMRDGLMPFGVDPRVVLSNSAPAEVLAREVAQAGGLLFFAHPEEPRPWHLAELNGMEIYNVHTDLKRFKSGLRGLLPDLLINQRRYPEQVLRLIFDRPEEFRNRWDGLNRTRHLTGIAGNDCHQNTGIRAIYTDRDTLRIEDTSPRKIKEWKLNWLTRSACRLVFGKLKPGNVLFGFQLDPYERMSRYVKTHVLAEDLSERGILESLRAGRAFVGFDMIADSSGFMWRARTGEATAIFGESVSFNEQTRLECQSPLPCRFTVLGDGTVLYRTEGRSFEWSPPQPGKYRVEAELNVAGNWVPWVYANPIELVK